MKPLRHFATSPLRHFATSPLRHASRLVTLIGLTLACATANAALIVNVEGVRGSGKTTWTLSGSSTTGSGTFFGGNVAVGIGTNTQFRPGGSLIGGNLEFLSTTWRPTNSAFAATGSPKLTIGSEERTITHLRFFADDDGDRIGFRVNRELFYLPGVNSSWTGSFTLDLDISNFKIGTHTYNKSDALFFASDLTLIFKETTSVPEPSSLALLGLALAGLRFSRKRKGAQPRA